MVRQVTPQEIVVDVEAFRRHPQTARVASCPGVGEVWVFQERVPYLLPDNPTRPARRLSINGALRPIFEYEWTVHNPRLLERLVAEAEAAINE